MDAERWKQISEVAAVAAETEDADAREALLASHPELRAEVESLLGYLKEDSGPLDHAPFPVDSSPYEGQRLGPYRVLRELGSGGMGIVLLARREEPGFDFQVALKLARVSFRSEFFSRRFLEERHILAKLEHPNIARLLDGGMTEDGTPFLAMQYVDGLPLDTWCAAQNPTLRRRLEMIRKICGAVEYAHEHLVVHRDLKPANILVTAAGEPMLLDFGTARLLDPAGQTGATATALPMMTARYASPEQARGMAGSIRSDVYSLGVLLYELLTGQWPYNTATASTPELLRAVNEQDATPPSRRVGEDLRRQVQGDLDAIVLKALDKDPARRYATAGLLAEDVRRHLEHEPVTARHSAWTYVAGRFLRRHKWAVTAAGTVALSLATATAYSLRQAALADRERAKAAQVATFLESLLGGARPGTLSPLASGGRDVRMVDVVNTAAARIGDEFRENPDVEAALRATVGGALVQLGEAGKAKPHIDRAVELSERLHGPEDAATVRALTVRATLRLATGDYEQARQDLLRTLAWHEARQHPDLSFQHGLLAESFFRRGDLARARQHWESALAAMRVHFGDRHVSTATMLNNLANVSANLGDMPAAETYFAEAAAVMRTLPGPPGNLVYPLLGLARAHFFRAEYPQARQLLEEAYAHAKKTGGDRHPNTASAALQLALVRAYAGEFSGEDLARATLPVLQAIHPPGHMEIARGLTTLGRILIVAGKADAALAALNDAYAIDRKIYPKNNWRPAEAQLFRGAALAHLGRRKEAGVALESALREMRAVLKEDHPRVQEARRIYERCLQTAASCTLP
ncbi:MAG: serine/threonine protein kinase [Bryobacterales bacterium]|nr:serine/threonine protein kinase [Bryobacterales bacterium]